MAYLILIFLSLKEWLIINNISLIFKSTRESAGLSLEEVSKDLDISETLLIQIEEGNIGAFKDIFELKQYLTEYAKYLGLNSSEVIDEFNEFMFEKTSKIPMKDIEVAAKEKASVEANDKRVASPYTKAVPITSNKSLVLTLIVVVILAVLAVIWSIKQVTVGNVTTNMLNYFAK